MTVPSTDEQTPPEYRFILLGASNLAIGFPILFDAVAGLSKLPDAGSSEIVSALGHGRSYGKWSSVLIRSLPGITQCALWDDLSKRPTSRKRPLALVTDVGNDLLYGFDSAAILAWVADCLARLREQNARIVLTLPPIASLRQISRWRFEATKRCFFPLTDLSWEKMNGEVERISAGLQRQAADYDATLIEQPPQWYGFDPIHYRMSQRVRIWTEVLAAWSDELPPEWTLKRAAWKSKLLSWRLAPAVRRFPGWTQRTAQPAYQHQRLSVSLY